MIKSQVNNTKINKKQICRLLLDWYDENARVLPWRFHPTPYRVWISEIMLQQTRVEAVIPYYLRFMEALPDVFALANVKEDALLKLWQGLGYYSRARNLKKAAQMVESVFDGVLPRCPEELKRLPGIGEYTAGAIASIAYQLPAPAVDGNVLRVLSRLLTYSGDVGEPAVRRELTQVIEKILPAKRPGDFNQALMDLGATICLPNGAPLCGSCPLNTICLACQQGKQESFPVKTSKKPRKIQNRTILVIVHESSVLLVKRPDKGLLAGMWEFPNLTGALTLTQAENQLREWGLTVVTVKELPLAKHIFTHMEWHMSGILMQAATPLPVPGGSWVMRENLEDYAIPVAMKPYLPGAKSHENAASEKE